MIFRSGVDIQLIIYAYNGLKWTIIFNPLYMKVIRIVFSIFLSLNYLNLSTK